MILFIFHFNFHHFSTIYYFIIKFIIILYFFIITFVIFNIYGCFDSGDGDN